MILKNLLQHFPILTISNKQHLMMVIKAISGQNNLNSHQHHIDNSNNRHCAYCPLTKENSKHVLIHCPSLLELRVKLDYENILEDISNPDRPLNLKKLTKLIFRSNRFN